MDHYSYEVWSTRNVVAIVVFLALSGYLVLGSIGMFRATLWSLAVVPLIAMLLLGWYLFPTLQALKVSAHLGPGGVACHQGPNTWRLSWEDIIRVGRSGDRVLFFARPGALPVLGRGGYRVAGPAISGGGAERGAVILPVPRGQLLLVSLVLHHHLGPLIGPEA